MSSESHENYALSKPIDPSMVRVLRLLDPIARSADCEYFVAGATARDLILVNVCDAGNADRLDEQEIDLLEAVGFDVELAGAELLGRDVASICKTQALGQARSVLASESNCERLARHIAQGTLYDEAISTVERNLGGFRRGLLRLG